MFKQVNKLHIPRPPVLTPEVVTPRPNIRGLLPPPAQPRTIPVSGQRALPPSSQIYGRGFSLSPTTPLPTPPHQQVLGTSRVPPKALTFRPTLEKGAIRTGPGFTVKGGLKSRGQIGKRWAKILRTTPPEQAQRTIQDMPPHLRSDAVRFLRELWGRQ